MPSAKWLLAEAENCRRIAREVESPTLRSTLLEIADEYRREAERPSPQAAGDRRPPGRE
jgi:hypothetical protein